MTTTIESNEHKNESTNTNEMTRKQEFENLAGPAKAWLAHEEVALHEVLAAVFAMKEKGFLNSVTGLRLDEEDQRLLTFCKFAEEHFLSEDTCT